jgi:Txe/YoeB family toxin of Txe-Axe toxin-antitoxin module
VGMILFLSFLSSHFTLAKTYEIMAGRKKKLTQKLADQILELIADGFTIRETFENLKQILHGNLLEPI